MTLFIKWLKEDDAEFRKSYEVAVGEDVQDDPEDCKTHWKIGSSRATKESLVNVPCEWSDIA
jgi:hypothetical protein